MEFSEILRKRRMVRDFDRRSISPEVVERILAAAQRGPSSGFTQGFELLVFAGPAETTTFWEAIGPETRSVLQGARNAPLVIVPFAHEAAYVERYKAADKALVGRRSGADFPAPYWFVDTAFSAMLILLAAIDGGLGAFYFSLAPTSNAIPAFRAALGIPDAFHPIGAIAIGYPGPEDRPPERALIRQKRRSSEALIHRARW
jgi:nitroreductase